MASGKKTEVAVAEQYVVVTTPTKQLGDLIKANVGPGGISPLDLDRVRMPTGGSTNWTIPSLEGDKIETEIEAVIIHQKDGRLYWSGPYTGSGKVPDCTSDDGVTGHGDPGGVCEECPFAQWNSDPKGGRGQACKQVRYLFLVRSGDRIPIVLVLPPTSLAAIRQYGLRLASKNRHTGTVVSRFKLKESRNADGVKYASLVTEVARALTNEEIEAFRTYSYSLKPILEKVRPEPKDYDAQNGKQ